MVTLAAMTGLDTLHARPRAALEGMKTYGTFCKAESQQSMVPSGLKADVPSPRKEGEGATEFPEAQCPR